MSCILTYVRVALATSYVFAPVQSVLEIPAADEIHLEDRNQTCVSTVTFESCGTTNGRINLYIKLEKHKLDQMAERNIRISLDKRIAFLKLSYGVSEGKRARANMISVLYSRTVLISEQHVYGGVKIHEATCR